MSAYLIGKQRLSIGQTVPVYAGVSGKLDKHEVSGRQEDETSDPSGSDIDWASPEWSDEPTHRHMGYPKDHPVRLRHHKSEVDHLHGDEDKLADQYKDLAIKAKSGKCTPEEIKQLRSVKAQMSALNAGRTRDARTVMFGAGVRSDGAGPRQGSPSAQHTSYSGPRHDQQEPVGGRRPEKVR